MSVVLGFVPTAAGRAALDRAVHEAAKAATTLVVVSEQRSDHGAGGAADPDTIAEVRRAAAARDVPVELRGAADGRSAADQLVDLSYEDDVELLVIGLRRRSPVGKLLMGSTAQQVLLDAGCAVLSVKPPVEARA
ncbi:universal stress protein [Georgenia sp. SYP-B2076]|uniref:universal stress protein n=1 Tax=Georgenia sp. SYP-B2076 TaxID=2495881 RepID=UPI000F8EEAD7|nr:universal stress protein [Georgenia sp. SYP-B2076]